MKLNAQFFTTPTGQLIVVAALAAVAVGVVAWQRAHRAPSPAAAAASSVRPTPSLPKVFQRAGVRFEAPSALQSPGAIATTPPKPTAPPVLPLTIFTSNSSAERNPRVAAAPYGRLIPCETVVTLESNRLDTPIIGLVTESVFHAGQCVIPAGAEVHGRVTVDRARERLAASGPWVVVWKVPGANGSRELRVQGIALDRERDALTGTWGEHDGSAGLRGELLRTDDAREAKLFAATFLATATTALQETRASSSALGETLVPAATARNASLAGTSAILREYAQQIRESIARDGFYLRVPAGKSFYLYVTETIDPGRTHPVATQKP
ncbi:MAG: TrbI/VirB10 family protein [Opitutaceae bacterium]|nr:TrbI/VirB10 family protein [Opitutaceae bacterium]